MDWRAAALEIGVLALAIIVLSYDLVVGEARRSARRHAWWIASAGLVGLLAASFSLPVGITFTEAFVQDAFSLFVKQALLVAALLSVLAAGPWAEQRGWSQRSGDYLVLLLFATIGGMALVSARELLTLFVAFELLSLPLYVLTAIEKDRREASEGAIKVYLFGSVSSAAMLLGIGLVYSAIGSTFWLEARDLSPPTLASGVVLLLVGFGFKVAMFPFYIWVPDTYEAAPTPFVAFLSVAPKTAGIAALFRLHFELLDGRLPAVAVWIAVLAAATMVVGNLLALHQSNLKRLLAYSGVAQIGYVLLAVAAGSRLGAGMALFFLVGYLFSNTGAFLCVAALEAAGEEPTATGAANLIRRAPGLAAMFVVFLLSLGGIPFVLGFWGKMYVLLAAGAAGMWGLVFLAAALAVVALFYYLNVVRSIIAVPNEGGKLVVPRAILFAAAFCAAIVLAGGLMPNWFVEPAMRAVAGF